MGYGISASSAVMEQPLLHQMAKRDIRAEWTGGRMIHLLWWNHWRDYLRKAKAERDPIVRDVWCRSAAIAQANYLMHAACYWQGVRP